MGALIVAAALVNPRAWAAAPVLLQGDVEIEDLFKIVSSMTTETPTLSPVPISKTPGTVSIISQEEIRAMGAATVDEVLAGMPGFDAILSPMGFAGNIRGFGGSPFQEGIQYLIDGLLYNSPDKGGSSASPGYSSFPVPIEDVKKIEVIREPISALYGPNAFFGVVNVITKSGEDLRNGGQVSARAGNRNNGRALQRYSALYGNQKGDLDWAAATDFSRELGPLEVNQEARIQDTRTSAKIKYKNTTVSWLNQWNRTDPFSMGAGVGNTRQVQQSINLAGITASKDITDTFSLHVKSSFLSRYGSNCQNCHNFNYLKTRDPGDQREFFNRFYQQVHAKWTPLEKHQITVGAEFMYDKEHMDSGVLSQPRLVARTYAGFLQDVVALSDEWTATLGLREDGSDWSNSGGLASPRALFVYAPTDRETWRFGYTQAHRVPTYHDLHVFFKFSPDPANNQFLMGNTGLKPETIHTYNIGKDQWLNRECLVRVNAYYSIVQRQIDRRLLTTAETVAQLPGGVLPDGSLPVTTGPAQNQTRGIQWVNNPANAHIRGAEFEIHMRPSKKLDVNFNFDFKKVYFSKDVTAFMGGSRVPEAPEKKFGIGVTAAPNPYWIFNLTNRYRDSFYGAFWRQNTPQGRQRYPGKITTDFNVRFGGARGPALSLIGRNIFDQEAREWVAFRDVDLNTGRNFFLQLDWVF